MPDEATLTIKLDAYTAAQLAERAREEGVSPEQYAAELVVEALSYDAYPVVTISGEGFLASIEEQQRQIADGSAVLYSHEQVMAEARAVIEAAKARKR